VTDFEKALEEKAKQLYPPLHPAWSGTEHEAFIDGAEFGRDFISAEVARLTAENKKLRAALEQIKTTGEIEDWIAEIVDEALRDVGDKTKQGDKDE
jgi:hypothetical protein